MAKGKPRKAGASGEAVAYAWRRSAPWFPWGTLVGSVDETFGPLEIARARFADIREMLGLLAFERVEVSPLLVTARARYVYMYNRWLEFANGSGKDIDLYLDGVMVDTPEEAISGSRADTRQHVLRELLIMDLTSVSEQLDSLDAWYVEFNRIRPAVNRVTNQVYQNLRSVVRLIGVEPWVNGLQLRKYVELVSGGS